MLGVVTCVRHELGVSVTCVSVVTCVRHELGVSVTCVSVVTCVKCDDLC